MMHEILLDTFDDKPVSFVGELSNQAEAKVEFSDGIERRFVLKLYAIESGGFVPSIEYLSDAPDEQTGCIAEIVDLVKDIENFFFVFVPEDLLEKTPARNQDRAETDRLRRLETALRKTYEQLTFSFLDDLAEVSETNRSGEIIAKEKTV